MAFIKFIIYPNVTPWVKQHESNGDRFAWSTFPMDLSLPGQEWRSSRSVLRWSETCHGSRMIHSKNLSDWAPGWWLRFNPSEKYACQNGFIGTPIFGVKIIQIFLSCHHQIGFLPLDVKDKYIRLSPNILGQQGFPAVIWSVSHSSHDCVRF